VRDPAVLNNPANYTTPYIADSLQRNDADTLALAYNLEYDVGGGFCPKLRGGLRYADSNIDLRGHVARRLRDFAGRRSELLGAGGDPARPAVAESAALDAGPFDAMVRRQHREGRPALPGLPGRATACGQQTKALYALLGAQTKDDFAPATSTASPRRPITSWAIADYAFELGSIRVDGGPASGWCGPRRRRTGTQINADGTTTPDRMSSNSYTRALPSFNLRARFSDEFQMRFAYSKGLARPNFDQLSTNVTLNPPGTSGCPRLARATRRCGRSSPTTTT
jgi:iron complex outermembrane receptor protein